MPRNQIHHKKLIPQKTGPHLRPTTHHLPLNLIRFDEREVASSVTFFYWSLALRTRFGSQHQLLPMRESFLLGNTITSFRYLTVKSIFSCWEHGMQGLCKQALTDSCTTGSLKQ